MASNTTGGITLLAIALSIAVFAFVHYLGIQSRLDARDRESVRLMLESLGGTHGR